MQKEEVIDLIRDAGYGVLPTIEGGKQPRVRPMMPYLTEDNRLLLALLGRSRTIAQIKQNPQVEVCFVDRKMWYARVKGRAKVSASPDDKGILWENITMLRQYFGSIDDPHFNLLEIEIEEVEAMTPHQKIPETLSLK